jgi:spore coat-associated protein N
LTPHLGTSVNGPNGGDLADRIYITNIQGHFLQPPILPAFYGLNLVKSGDFYGPLDDNTHWTGLRNALGNHDGTLTLREFCDAKFVAYYYDLFPILRPNSQPNFGFIISGKFGSAADDNNYQGSSCTFTLDAMASQDSPTAGCVLITDEQKTDSQDDGSE